MFHFWTNFCLDTLSLADNSLSAAAIRFLELLAFNSTLTSLDVSSNPILQDGAVRLGESLATCPSQRATLVRMAQRSS